MNVIFFALAAVVFSFSDALPQIIPLRQYNNETISTILTAEPGGNLYLASNDPVYKLQRIQLITGSVTINLDQLLDIPYISVGDNIVIKSGNDASSAAGMSGFLYVTTAVQANDKNFFVTVVNGVTPLSRNGSKTTTVVLNTQTKDDFPPFDDPGKTTYVTQIRQQSTSSMNFHYGVLQRVERHGITGGPVDSRHGVPNDDYNDRTSNQFFENPMLLKNYADNGQNLPDTRAFFTNIEPLQINAPYWYITSNGSYDMVLDSKYMDVHVRDATAVTTTGVIISTGVLMDQVVNFKVDPTRQGRWGVLSSTFLDFPVNYYMFKSDVAVATGGFDGTQMHALMESDFAPSKLEVNSSALFPGELYLQYFVISGDPLPSVPTTPSTTMPASTTTTTTTTSTVATTTKSTGSLDLINLLIMFLMYILH